MTKFLITTNILLAGLLAWFFINGNISLNKTPASECSTCSNICADYSGTSFHKLETEMLDSISSNYKQSVIGASSTNSKIAKTDASNIWFSLDTLKRFIWEIESKTCGIACGKEKKDFNLGIRIYYARYPDSTRLNRYPDLTNVPNFFGNCHTLFMVPTYDFNDPKYGLQHMDFDPGSKFNSADCKFPLIETLPTAMVLMKHSPLAPPPPTGNNNTAQNHGGLCPPLVCEPGTAF